MKFTTLTLFPDFIDSIKEYSIIRRAIENNLISVESVNIRDFAINKHGQVDDYPYGGGQGMVMMVEPVYKAIESVKKENSHVVFLSPQGKVLSQEIVKDLSKKEHIVLLCGHYEGIDARITNHYVDYEISIGDYVLTGGEIPAMVLIDSMARFIDGVVGKEESLVTDSHYNILLQQDEYTKPRVFNGYHVPRDLVSGDHKKIAAWNKNNAIEKTKRVRYDLYEKYLREESKDGFNKKNRKWKPTWR